MSQSFRQLARTTAIFTHHTQTSSSSAITRPLLQRRYFRTTTPIMAPQIGDAIPSIELMEGSPGDKVNLSKELSSGPGLIIGVPAAFSPGCSETHVPGYINSPKTKAFQGPVFVIAVNDAFVMKAWGKNLDPDSKSGIRFVADPKAEFTKALGLDFDASDLLGNQRSVRYAIRTDGGKIASVHEEPDKIGIDVSSVDKVLG